MAQPVVGVVGGGQLARMMFQASLGLDIRLRVLAAGADDAAAAPMAEVMVGEAGDLDALRRFARGCDVLTFDHEHVPTEHLRRLVTEGVTVRPRPETLVHAQDKAAMRRRLSAAGIPCPAWAPADTAQAVRAVAARVGWPLVLKSPRGGYDGKGVTVAEGPAAVPDALAEVGAGPGRPALVEQHVAFTAELSVLLARSPHGQTAVYPVVRTVQRDGVCREVIAPAPVDDERAVAAHRIALRIAAELDVTGVLAVEMFDTATGLVVNELAMRPHNSGHWTIDAAVTSQFEQHLRAVLDLPLGSPAMTAPHAVMANVLGGDHPDLYGGYLHCLAHDPGLRVHNYGKKVTPGRKVGHVTVAGHDPDDLLTRARHAAAFLRGDIDGGEIDGGEIDGGEIDGGEIDG